MDAKIVFIIVNSQKAIDCKLGSVKIESSDFPAATQKLIGWS